MEDGTESLSNFLRKNHNEEIASDEHNLSVDSEKMPVQRLKRLVNKFIYLQHLNNRYWDALEGGSFRIRKFKEKKSEKQKKLSPAPATIQREWLRGCLD